MYRLFANHHPLPKLKQGPGLIANFVDVLVKEFPNHKKEVLKEFATIRTNNQIKIINKSARNGKRSTVRGARNLVETINN